MADGSEADAHQLRARRQVKGKRKDRINTDEPIAGDAHLKMWVAESYRDYRGRTLLTDPDAEDAAGEAWSPDG